MSGMISTKALRGLLVLINGVLAANIAQADESFNCTLVIGFSQVGWDTGWYRAGGAFESAADNDGWQLLWENMGGVDRWRDPHYRGWYNAVVSPCHIGSQSPDRVLLSVSGPYGEDVGAWTEAIEDTIDVIRQRYGATIPIVLQPVVGGPALPSGESKTCYLRHQAVRASWQHNYVVRAIEAVERENVEFGARPVVGTCAHYADSLGHLTAKGGAQVGAWLGAYYNSH